MMKTAKELLLVGCVVLLLIGVCAPVFVGAAADSPIIYLNSEPVFFQDVQPVIIDGTTLIPVRGIFEKMGCTVTWVGEKRNVEIRRGALLLVLRIDNPYITLATITNDGTPIKVHHVELNVKPCVVDGRTMIPVRAIAECLGAKVEWLPTIKAVKITDDSLTNPVPPEIISVPTSSYYPLTPDYGYYEGPADTYTGNNYFYDNYNQYPNNHYEDFRREEYVQFYDEGIEMKLCDILEKNRGEITEDDCLDIECLDLLGYDVRSLEDLEYFDNLTSLYISDCPSIDIEPVLWLDNLKELQISFCDLYDIELLSEIDGLTYLDLSGNQIEDLSPLEHMEELEVLFLDDNCISDVSLIYHVMDNLDKFSIYGNPLDVYEIIYDEYDEQDFYDIFRYVSHERERSNSSHVIFNDSYANYFFTEVEKYHYLDDYTNHLQDIYGMETYGGDVHILSAEYIYDYDDSVEWLRGEYPDIMDDLLYMENDNKILYASMCYLDDGYVMLQTTWGN